VYVPLFGYEPCTLAPSPFRPFPKSHFAVRFEFNAVKSIILAFSAVGVYVNAASASVGADPKVISSSSLQLLIFKLS
jgi:hypothetical protein